MCYTWIASMYERNYHGVIWTDHALERLTERNISQGDAWVAFNRPDQSRRAESPNAWVYYKTFGNRRLEVVAKKNERGEWVILSVWERMLEQKNRPSQTSNWLRTLLRKIF